MPDEDHPTGAMPDDAAQDETRRAADRLERALERIAATAHSARPVGPDQSAGEPSADRVPMAEIAERLDAMIARLRSALRTA